MFRRSLATTALRALRARSAPVCGAVALRAPAAAAVSASSWRAPERAIATSAIARAYLPAEEVGYELFLPENRAFVRPIARYAGRAQGGRR